MGKTKTLDFVFGEKHRDYMRRTRDATINVAEGAVRAGKTVDNVFAFAYELETAPDKLHLATGSTIANAKLNIGDCNGYGLEGIFRGRCRWGKYKDNECLRIKTKTGLKVVIFAGGGKADSFKKIRGNSYGMWIATEINLHHDNTVKEAFNRQLAAKRRKIYWDLNPDNPNAVIYSDYINKYAVQQEAGEFLGGYNYEHFTIFDNKTVSAERLNEIISQYDKDSVWYRRDILGQRCAADGLIYQQFVNNRNARKIRREDVKDLMEINIAVDFGGGNSGHAFVATGITRGYNKLIALASERHMRKDQREEIDPDKLGELFVDFCRKIIAQYGVIHHVYCDNAEQTLIAGLRTAARKAGLGWLVIGNALKTVINDRIRAALRLIAQGRFFYIPEECKTLDDALSGAIWNPKNLTEDERLDDGTSDIDTLDAFEYTFERSIAQLIRYER